MPKNLGSLKDLLRFTVSGNQLETDEAEGFSFLNSLTNCSNLKFVGIGGNRFKGELPTSIANFSTTLQVIEAEDNQISGSIPEGITNLIGLMRLDISGNSFTGEIPEGIGKFERLGVLRLFDNRISGAIPETIGNITKLQRLYLYNNYLSGNIPPSLENCKQLEVLLLFSNNLTGFIPKEVVSLPRTLSFMLAQNSLSGPLPVEVGNMSKLIELDVLNNRLSGEIPSTLSKCIMLESLNLGDNLFGGRIPSALNSLKSLHTLDLSRNNLSGQIQAYLQNFTLLQYLNLSYNDLDGEVPEQGVFRNISAFSIVGNRKLCGGIKSLGLPSCQVPVKQKRGTSLAVKIAIPVAISCLVQLAFLLVCLCRKKRSESSPSIMLPTDEQFRQVSYSELVQATNQFSSSNLIGEGRYGFVCRGVLGNDGTAVAVKVLKLTEKGAAKSFMAECNALRNIRHRNLIKIVTTCSSIDSKGNDFKALIFEFMPNGSLEEWLHQSEGDQIEHPRSLSLTQRLSIAIDMASALEYLHHHCQAAIVHGDLKPSNILLGHDMTARVSDFGLARYLSDSLPTISQTASSSTGIRGTVGYVAPGIKASIQGDVYSFGILLLEMFTGRKPTYMTFEDGQNIHQFTKAVLPERVMEIAEPSLFSEVGSDDDDNKTREGKIKDCLVAVLTIGVSCSVEPPRERMDMRDAVAELCKTKEYGMGGMVSAQGDLYSYGFLLLEMFTGRRPTDDQFKDNCNLHNFVALSLPDQVMGNVDQSALHHQVVGEATGGTSFRSDLRGEQVECLVSVFQIGVACLAEYPHNRLNMKQVLKELPSARDNFLGNRLLIIAIDSPVIILDFHRPRVLHYSPPDQVDPVLLVLVVIGDEVHGEPIGGDLESVGLVDDILGALDSEAVADRDDAAGGVLGNEGTTVAVKVLKLTEKGAAKSFMAECNALRNIRHRTSSTLVQRLSIATDMASGLEYLHHHCQAEIAHGDLKPSNILLGLDMTARVGRKPTDTTFEDGLNIHQFTKATLPKRVMEIAKPSPFSEVGGDDNDNKMREGKIKDCLVVVLTIGVSCSMEPPGERMDMRDVYGMGCMVSTQGDVYNFEVLLLELFTGRQPSDESFEDNLNLHNFVKMALPSKVLEIVDRSAIQIAEDTEKLAEVGCSTNPRSELSACLVSVVSSTQLHLGTSIGIQNRFVCTVHLQNSMKYLTCNIE
ncbi:putative receptor-like protein kinase At3g47110 [Rhododendron vialii]|uniref:putative receptor-like protein kinase At3g47110 n=1 Tax=Rhododendron vialii TaxID=182163 RepID=UPI00265F864A|nr:putative receptor-like protein kinase At3g47110 [Rhododendron vialii]